MTEHILLVEPEYYTQFPPIGLLKLSTYEKNLGNTTELIRGCKEPLQIPNKIYVTSLFTWSWRPVWRAIGYYKKLFPQAEIHLGGIYASLMPKHAKLSGADIICRGILPEVEGVMPDYSLRPDWDGSIIFSSRGCNRNCGFCAVPKIEGKLNTIKSSIKDCVWPTHSRIIFFDNNFLFNKNKFKIFDELIELDKVVDFNQGLDARLIDEEIAECLGNLKYGKNSAIRIAYDTAEEEHPVKKTIQLLSENGISKRRIFVYALFNFNDTPESFLERVVNILNWGAVCYPMRFEPLISLEKNLYISKENGWTKEKVGAVQSARRVIGYGGSFPPYQGLIDKFQNAKSFDGAFELREENKKGND